MLVYDNGNSHWSRRGLDLGLRLDYWLVSRGIWDFRLIFGRLFFLFLVRNHVSIIVDLLYVEVLVETTVSLETSNTNVAL